MFLRLCSRAPLTTMRSLAMATHYTARLGATTFHAQSAAHARGSAASTGYAPIAAAHAGRRGPRIDTPANTITPASGATRRAPGSSSARREARVADQECPRGLAAPQAGDPSGDQEHAHDRPGPLVRGARRVPDGRAHGPTQDVAQRERRGGEEDQQHQNAQRPERAA